MSISSGKYYDAKAVNLYFNDIADAFKNFKRLAIAHNEEAAKVIDPETWVGVLLYLR